MPVLLRWFLRLALTNPITVRLVQNGSKRSRHNYIRVTYLGVLIVVLLYALLLNAGSGDISYRDLAAAGSSSFKWIAYLQIALICILAPVFMAGAIAQEADPKTWDILLTTPLSATQIVLGNLFGRLFFILALLFSSLPLFAVTQYFGGVPGESIFASYLIAACAALVVGASAIALSVSRLVGRRAVFTFYVGVISYLALTWAVDSIHFGGTRVSWMTAINPFLTLEALLDPTGYPRAKAGSLKGLASWFLEKPVTTWCILAAGLSLLLMLLSTITVRLGGFVAITGNSGSPESKPSLWKRLTGQGAAQMRAARTVWSNPIAWREAAARNATFGRILARYAFIGAGGIFGLIILWLFHVNNLSITEFRQIMLYTLIGEIAVIALVAVNMSATAVSREREDGTLDLLLTTPMTPAQYLSGKLQGIVAYLVPLLAVPIGTLGLAGLYCLGGGFGRADGALFQFKNVSSGTASANTIPIPVILPEAGLIAALVMIPFAALCVIIGMQWSLKSKGTIGSVMGTVGVVGVMAGTMGLCAWNAGADMPVLGPVLAAFSPASVIFSCVRPEEGLFKTIVQNDLTSARAGLAIGALITAAVFGGVVYMMHASMAKTFDMTVRKLAGTR